MSARATTTKNTKKVVAVFATLLVASAGLIGHVSVVGRIANRPRQLMDWERRRASQGRRRDLEHAPLRVRLTEHLAALGKVRPPLRQRRL